MEDKIQRNEEEISDLVSDVEELKRQIEDLISQVSEIGGPEDTQDSFSEVSLNGETRTVLHWVEPSEVDCSTVTGLESARQAFKDAAIARDQSPDHPEVQHGDVMILLCERARSECRPKRSIPTPCYYGSLR